MTTETPTATPEEVLRAAADHIRANGWTKGDYRRGKRVCMVGAVMAVTGLLPNQVENGPLGRLLIERTGDPVPSNWNDHKSRKEVLAILDPEPLS